MNTVITKGLAGDRELLPTMGFGGARVFYFPAQHTIITRGFGPLNQLLTRGYGSSIRKGGGKGVGILRRPQKYNQYDLAIPTMHMYLPRFPEDIQVKVTLLNRDTKEVTAVLERISAKPFIVSLKGDVEHD